MLTTSNFAKCKDHPQAVAICRGIPKDFTGLRLLALAPTEQMLKSFKHDPDSVHFAQEFTNQVLSKLELSLLPSGRVNLYQRDSEGRAGLETLLQTFDADAVLLCWENFNKQCHRRLVAEWIEARLGIEVPEFGRKRSDSLPFIEQPVQRPRWPVKAKAVAASVTQTMFHFALK